MSEYWVSKKKYLCKYCDTYIADDAPSRQHHENGLRHKGNVERFIRGIYKAGEKKKKDQEEEKREMARVEQAARAAFAQDVSSGHAKAPSAPVASTSSAPRKPPTKPSNPFANYSTAAQLGYTDPDVEKLELRKQQSLVGEWQVVEPTPVPPPQEAQGEGEDVKPDVIPGAGGSQDTNTKRPAEAPPEDDDRTFKLRKKTVTVGLGQLYDPSLISIELKKKKVKQTETETSSSTPNPSTSEVPRWTAISLKPKDPSSNASTPPLPSSSVTPKAEETNDPLSQTEKPPPPAPSRWAKVQWGQPLKEEEATSAISPPEPPHVDRTATGESVIKKEEGVSIVKTEANDSSLDPEPEQSTAGLFKKRKAPIGAGRGRRQL